MSAVAAVRRSATDMSRSLRYTAATARLVTPALYFAACVDDVSSVFHEHFSDNDT
jgi:hypothetical protein